MADPTRLYHYTCSHAAPQIEASGALRPHRQPQLDGRLLVWFTDMQHPDRDALGLTSHLLRCDRTEHRVTVETGQAVWWPVYARRMPRVMRDVIETCPGVLPMHWWVASGHVPILRVETVALVGGGGRG